MRNTGRPPSPAPPRGRPRSPKGRCGFTLVELTIVILIIGILASLGAYTYRRMVNKARMTQAQVVLKHLHKVEETFFGENGWYTTDLNIMGYDPVKYDYYRVGVTVDNTAPDFLGVATGIRAMAGDLWTVTKVGIPTQDNVAKLRF